MTSGGRGGGGDVVGGRPLPQIQGALVLFRSIGVLWWKVEEEELP